MIFTQEQRARFRQLRRTEDEGTLTPDEGAELAALMQHIEDAEAAYLRPATERMRAERIAAEEQNRSLEDLLLRGEALVARLQAVLAELEEERRAVVAPR